MRDCCGHSGEVQTRERDAIRRPRLRVTCQICGSYLRWGHAAADGWLWAGVSPLWLVMPAAEDEGYEPIVAVRTLDEADRAYGALRGPAGKPGLAIELGEPSQCCALIVETSTGLRALAWWERLHGPLRAATTANGGARLFRLPERPEVLEGRELCSGVRWRCSGWLLLSPPRKPRR